MPYSEEKVLELINNPLWDQVTDMQNWRSEELRELLVEDTEPDKWRYVSAHLMEFPDLITNAIADAPLPRPHDSSRDPCADVFLSNELGNLSRLPLEVVWRIIDNMTIEAFLKFAATSRLARSVCKQHPAYRNTATYLPSMLVVLKSLGLQQWVSVGALWGEMQQPKCRSCGEKAHLLFVPTCDRICVNCLMFNPAYWYMSIVDARTAFALQSLDFARVPTFGDVVLRYVNNTPPLHRRSQFYLCPVKPILELAIQMYGSRESMQIMAEKHAIDTAHNSSDEEKVKGFIHRVCRDAPLGKLPCDPTQVPKMDYNVATAQTLGGSDLDVRRGATWIPFLIPRLGSPVKLYRCKGCLFLLGHFKITSEHRRYMGDADLDVTAGSYWRILKGRSRTVRTWDDMQEHIPKCLGSGLRMWRRFILTRHPDEVSSDF